MFSELGYRLGVKIDNGLEKLKIWNLQRWWYKPYVWIMFRKWIKIKKWKTEEHFYNSLNYAVGNINKEINWINEKQYKKYEELFKKHYEGE